MLGYCRLDSDPTCCIRVPCRVGPGRGVATLEALLTGVDARGVAILPVSGGLTLCNCAVRGGSKQLDCGDCMPESLSVSDARGGVTVDVPDPTELLDDSLHGWSVQVSSRPTVPSADNDARIALLLSAVSDTCEL